MDAPEDFGTVYDPVETLSYVAARASRITLGTSVLDALFQSPIILARRLATLDRFSEGRLIVGVGQGWMEQEFEAAGVSMKRRDAGFEEHLLAMRARSGVPTRCASTAASTASPKPTLARNRSAPGGPRLIAGAASPSALERAGRLGVGLTLVIFDWATIRESIETFRAAASAAGVDPDTLPVMLQVNGNVTAEPQDQRGPLVGSLEQVATDLDQAAKLGIEHIYWNTDKDPLRQLSLLAQLRRG